MQNAETVLPPPPVALSIAGSDPSGGAGIQADLKTFSALGAFGTCVISALTAQSTRGVTGVHEVPVDFIRQQVQTLADDVRIDVVKIGMLASAPIAREVERLLHKGSLRRVPVVLDPVMVSTSGSRLLDDDAVTAVRSLAGRADVLTPNLPEAAVLLGVPVARDLETMRAQARRLAVELGCQVLLKGGHLCEHDDAAIDVWAEPGSARLREFVGPRIDTDATHGTGCTLSSAIAALYARTGGWQAAVAEAKAWLTEALRHGRSLEVGGGPGPVHHFHEQARWH